jgi:COP9 signalosome complex subunit 1
MQKAALETARNYEKEAVERIRLMSLAAADLEVKGSRRQQQGMQAQISDLGFDDLPSA